MKIGLDIGGVISKYPDEFRELLAEFQDEYNYTEVYIITDQHPKEEVIEIFIKNGFIDGDYYNKISKHSRCIIIPERVHCADYEKYGNMAKAVLIKELGIQIFIDDFEGYLQWDSSLGPQPILLKVQPDMFKPYWHEDWKVQDKYDFGRRVAPAITKS